MISSQTLPRSIQLQLEALIASVMEHKDCSKQVAVGSVINLLVETLTSNHSLGFVANTQQQQYQPQQALQNFWPNRPSESSRSESPTSIHKTLQFQYKPLQNLHAQYTALLKNLKSETSAATSDSGDVLALKLFSFDSGLHDRYMSEKKYNFYKVLKRVIDSVRFRGNMGPNEQDCLLALQEQIGSTFCQNSKLYYSGRYCATPDAVQVEKGKVVAVAEFKTTRFEGDSLTAKVINPAKLQLSFAMKAAQVQTGYLVIYLLASGDKVPLNERTRIVTLTSGSDDLKKVQEREKMQLRFVEDLCQKTTNMLPEEFVSLVSLNSGGCNQNSDEDSDSFNECLADKERLPDKNPLTKRKASKL